MICSEHMATLELSNSSLTLDNTRSQLTSVVGPAIVDHHHHLGCNSSISSISKSSISNSASDSMQRSSRGMARGQQQQQQREHIANDTEHTPNSTPPRITRNNTKLKVLVRSHAMREETSPPREPTPTPCINLIPSPSNSPHHHHHSISTSPICHQNHSSTSPSSSNNPPCLNLSPGISPTSGNSAPCSPTTILVGTPPSYQEATTPPNSSPNHSDGADCNLQHSEISTVRTQDALNSALSRKLNGSNELYNKEQHHQTSCAVNNKSLSLSSTSSISSNSDAKDSSPMLTSLNQKNGASNNRSNNNSNQQQQQQSQQQSTVNYICDCYHSNCTKCTQKLNNNNEIRNINNNNLTNSNNNNNNNNSAVSNNNTVAVSNCNSTSGNTLTVNRSTSGGKHKLRHQSSSQGSFEGSLSTSPCLSRDSSTEQYTDTTGIDLTQFILETLNKNAKDRVMMLKIEQELVTLAKDKVKTHYKFPPMSSYQRMLVHRCAAYFGMDHNIEISGKCVVVNKTKNTRIPEMRFRDHIGEDLLFPEEPRRSILKRDSNSFEDCHYKSPDRQFDNRRSKSFEEREEEYEKARRRIFKDKDGIIQDCGSSEEFSWAEMPWPESECSKIRLLPPEQQQPNTKQNRLLKVQSVDGKSETLRPCVAKSYSFGGYGGAAVSVLTRGDSVTSTHSAGPRLLTKQDSSTSTISWRLSPSSSGYKSQSQRSDSVTPSPTATPHQLSDASEETVEQAQQTDNHQSMETTPITTMSSCCSSSSSTNDSNSSNNQLVWAVTDMQSVPKGSVLINPQTGQPFTNQDGSIYHFDPLNPPPGFTTTVTSKPPQSPSKPSQSQQQSEQQQQQQKSPIKDRSQSPTKKPSKPKQLQKYETSYTSSKAPPPASCLINSSTSPSLPLTPPVQSIPPAMSHAMSAYATSTPIENMTNLPLQSYPIYHPPNGYGTAVQPPGTDGTMSVYHQPSIGMVYTTPYGMPAAPYENRPDASVTDLSGYFVNMSVSDPNCNNAQPLNYQPTAAPATNNYWSQQQPITYYQPASQQLQPQSQRYPIQIPLPPSLPPPNQTQQQPNPAAAAYVSTSYGNYVPVTPNPTAMTGNTDLMPVYASAPMQMVYPTGPQPSVGQPTNTVYIQNPNPMVYSQNPIFPQGTVFPYPPNTATPTGHATSTISYPAPTNTSYVPNMTTTTMFDPRGSNGGGCLGHRSTPKTNKSLQNRIQSQPATGFVPHHGSNPSSNSGSNSPAAANTVITTGYYTTNALPPPPPPQQQQGLNYHHRQCTPPETPPSQVSYGYPSNYVQHSVIFRPLGGIRASPPVNLRSSRSPTPAPEYSQVGSVDRNQRYAVGPAVYHGMPCIVPAGDMRLVSGRAQPPIYRQPYRQQSHQHQQQPHQHQQQQQQQNYTQSVSDSNSSGRSHKVRKPRTKVPALPPSGRQSNQSVPANSQQRY